MTHKDLACLLICLLVSVFLPVFSILLISVFGKMVIVLLLAFGVPIPIFAVVTYFEYQGKEQIKREHPIKGALFFVT